MAKLSPQDVAAKWANRLSGASADIQKGVMAVTVSPTQKAAAAKAKMRQNILAAIDNGSWERGLQAVSLQDWQNRFVQVGIPRITQGTQAAQSKVADFHSKLAPIQDALSAQVAAMPKMNLQDGIARMTKFVTGMAASRGKFK
jgi:hypothetical protein